MRMGEARRRRVQRAASGALPEPTGPKLYLRWVRTEERETPDGVLLRVPILHLFTADSRQAVEQTPDGPMAVELVGRPIPAGRRSVLVSSAPLPPPARSPWVR
jgi:hypothetical protein